MKYLKAIKYRSIEDIKTGSSVSFNPSICFYVASSIKILADLMMFEKVMNGECSLCDKIIPFINLLGENREL